MVRISILEDEQWALDCIMNGGFETAEWCVGTYTTGRFVREGEFHKEWVIDNEDRMLQFLDFFVSYFKDFTWRYSDTVEQLDAVLNIKAATILAQAILTAKIEQ